MCKTDEADLYDELDELRQLFIEALAIDCVETERRLADMNAWYPLPSRSVMSHFQLSSEDLKL
jgi:hypothetical protein